MPNTVRVLAMIGMTGNGGRSLAQPMWATFPSLRTTSSTIADEDGKPLVSMTNVGTGTVGQIQDRLPWIGFGHVDAVGRAVTPGHRAGCLAGIGDDQPTRTRQGAQPRQRQPDRALAGLPEPAQGRRAHSLSISAQPTAPR